MGEDKTDVGVSLVVTTPDRLPELASLIHDECFCLDEVKYDQEQRTLEIPYRRIFHDAPRRLIRNWLVYKVFEVDVRRAILTFHDVDGFEVSDGSHIGEYSFNDLAYDGPRSTLTVLCCEDCSLRLRVSGLLIETHDIETRGKATISYLFGVIESNSSRVYD